MTNKQTGKQFTSHYTPAKTREYEKSVSVWAKDAMQGTKLINTPVAIDLVIVMPIPTSWPQWKKILAAKGDLMPTAKPDADNIEKVIKDGCNGVVWHDDSYVVKSSKRKIFTDGHIAVGVHVSVTTLTGHIAQITKKPEMVVV